jgi:hypothetical protein
MPGSPSEELTTSGNAVWSLSQENAEHRLVGRGQELKGAAIRVRTSRAASVARGTLIRSAAPRGCRERRRSK